MSTILIGIAGGTGSGKTTLTRHLKEHFGPEVTVIGHDNYYKRQDGKTLEERAKVNYEIMTTPPPLIQSCSSSI